MDGITRGGRLASDEESSDAPGMLLRVEPGAARRATICIPLDRPVLDMQGQWRWYPPAEADLSLLQSGTAPLLLDHDQRVESLVGVIETAWIEGAHLFALARFGQSGKCSDVWGHLVEGLLPHVSMATNFTPSHAPEGGILARDWRPYEVSVVALPGQWTARIYAGAAPPVIASARAAVIARAAGSRDSWRAWGQRIAAELGDARIGAEVEAELARLGEVEAARLGMGAALPAPCPD